MNEGDAQRLVSGWRKHGGFKSIQGRKSLGTVAAGTSIAAGAAAAAAGTQIPSTRRAAPQPRSLLTVHELNPHNPLSYRNPCHPIIASTING